MFCSQKLHNFIFCCCLYLLAALSLLKISLSFHLSSTFSILLQAFYQSLQNLSTHLLRHHHQKQTHSFDIYMTKYSKLCQFKPAIEELVLASPKSEIALKFESFPDEKQKAITSFSQMFQNLQNLTTLALKSSLTKNLLHFLRPLQDTSRASLYFSISLIKPQTSH